MSALRVSAPASTANLGSGFDTVALALDLRMTAEVRELPPGASSAWSYGGAHAPTHDGLRGCVEAGIVRIAPDAPPLAIALDNAIPLGAGLGSSAAAYALGAAIGSRFVDPAPDDDVLALAVAELEGHPDNALAAWYGGAAIAAVNEDGITSARFAPPPVEAAVIVPQIVLSTAEARALLPQAYPRADVVYNVQRAALLAAALASGRIDLLATAMQDRLHQPYRAGLVPGFDEIVALEDPALLGVALSGAGPSILALARSDVRRIGARIASIFARRGLASNVLTPTLSSDGVRIATAQEAGQALRRGAAEAGEGRGR